MERYSAIGLGDDCLKVVFANDDVGCDESIPAKGCLA